MHISNLKIKLTMKKKMLYGAILFGLCAFILFGCGFNSQKNAETPVNAISEELHQEQCDLLSKANEELAGINQKVRVLNDKIHEKNTKFTESQNNALDDFEAKQASINKRMHEIKNIKQEDWENFKATFEKDLEEINTVIDNIINEL
jgi:uncharacterized protein YoxC